MRGDNEKKILSTVSKLDHLKKIEFPDSSLLFQLIKKRGLSDQELNSSGVNYMIQSESDTNKDTNSIRLFYLSKSRQLNR